MNSITPFLDRLPPDERKYIENLPADYQWLALAGLAELEKRRANDAYRAPIEQAPARPDSAHGRDLAPVQFTPAPTEYVTPLDIAAELIRRKLDLVAQADSLWRAHLRADQGRGAHQTREGAIAILTAGGMARRTAERALAAGAGLVWDVTPDKRDRRVKRYHLRTYAEVLARLHDTMPPDRDPLTGPGKFARLPLEAYQGTSAYFAAHVIGAWLLAHPESSRKQQAEVFGLTVRQIQRAQHMSTTRHTPRIVIAPAPRYRNLEAESAELEARTTTIDGDQRHYWLIPGQDGGPPSVCWQDTNYYHDGPSRVVGPRRAKRIRAELKQRCPVENPPGPPVDPDLFPKRFDGENVPERLALFQERHPARGASILRQDHEGAPLVYDYRYSLATRLGGML